MIITTHRFALRGEVVESYIFVGTDREWQDDPRSHQPGWSTFITGSTVVANRLAVPSSVLAPPSHTLAGAAERPGSDDIVPSVPGDVSGAG